MHHALGSKPVVPAYGFTSRCVQNSVLLESSFGYCHRQDRNRTNAADSGTSEVAGAAAAAGEGLDDGPGDIGEGDSRSSAVVGSRLLLKLYANGFLQRLEGAQFFGGDQRQRAPG